MSQTSKALRITLLIYAIWWAVYGLLHIVSPELMMAKDPPIERVLGAVVLTFALGAGWAYWAKTWDRVRLLVAVQIGGMVLYTLSMAWGLLAGGIPAAAWPPTIIAAVFAVLLAVFYTRQQ